MKHKLVWYGFARYGGRRAHLCFAQHSDAMRWANKHDQGSPLLHPDETRSIAREPSEVPVQRLGAKAIERRLGRHFLAPRGAVG